MKTRMILIASFLIAGLVLTSFQKDKNTDVKARNTTVQSTNQKIQPSSAEFPGSYFGFTRGMVKNYPDPFESGTTIEYYVPVSGWVTIEVINMTERYVVRLVSEFKEKGHYRAFFDGTVHAPGRYRAEIRTGKFKGMDDMTKVNPEVNVTVPHK